jgi:hypothetical protein
MKLAETEKSPRGQPQKKQANKGKALPDITIGMHRSALSLDDISIYYFPVNLDACFFRTCFLKFGPFIFLLQPTVQEYMGLATRCIDFRTEADELQNKSSFSSVLSLSTNTMCYFVT